MLIVCQPRASGKTEKMLEWLRMEPSRILLVVDDRRAINIRYDHPDIAHRIMPWRTYWSQRPTHTSFGASISEVGIDDADAILQRMCWQPISAMSIRSTEQE